MTVVVCTDTRGGMLFAGRRQSRDRVMLADLAALVGDGRLWCRPFSEKLLVGAGLTPTVAEDCPSLAGAEDTVFIEAPPLTPYLPTISRLIVYSWCEAYPYDAALDLVPTALGFTCVETAEFEGNSHKKIRKEVYVR